MTLVEQLLQRAIDKDASDVHIKSDGPPYFRIDGDLIPRKRELSAVEVQTILDQILTPTQKDVLERQGEVDLALDHPKLGRFRVNVFHQRGTNSIVMRRIKSVIPSFEELHLPPAIERLTRLHRGLVLFTGTTGSGKSTSLAAIIDYINERRKCHVVTIEDPIEYTHRDKLSVVNQREIHIDTTSFSTALRAVMRQDPDVILVGEMRDLDTFQAAISATETGHLVFTTLHTTNAMQTVDRIVDLFPTNQQDQVRSQLSMNLKAIVCQRLLPRATGGGRVPACEILFVSPGVQKLIKENRLDKIPTAIQQGREDGSQSFNDSLFALIKAKLITLDCAMEVSDNPAQLNLMMQGITLAHMRGGILGEV
ncbi:MAG: PilT/PilU family type 4a pilus ATPase [Candidatus Hydrogenedentes bacterium]|nr:PilT/PilU family type 4a pilus ATPase [Candidatus Hydrogenedentota bacterium]